MTSYLIDINLWMAMTWGRHRHHPEAREWMNSRRKSRFLFCRFTMLGFLRLLTNHAVMGEDALVLSEALAIYDAWLGDPRVEFAMELRNTDSSFRQAIAPFARQPATKAIADCYLIAMAEVHGASIATLDRALMKTAQMRRVSVVLLGA